VKNWRNPSKISIPIRTFNRGRATNYRARHSPNNHYHWSSSTLFLWPYLLPHYKNSP
jgi:hypothetical protein